MGAAASALTELTVLSVNSDVDFLVEFNQPVGLFEFIEVRLYLQDILGCSVDAGNPESFKRTFAITCT
jgi:predicted nucleotidyltransferase